MTVLVTGGAGYIGSHVVRALASRGDRVAVIDNLSSGRREAVPDAVPLIEGDIRDRDLLHETMRRHGVDVVAHFAAEKSVPGSMVAPGRTFSVNVGGTLSVLEAMVEAGVERFVFSSTCAVYGTPREQPVDETAPVDPANPYGESKAMGERMIDWFDRAHGVRAVVLRYFNAAGADEAGDLGEDWTRAENLIPSVLRAAWTGRPVTVFGEDYPTRDGTAVRDYIHVTDLADAHVLAIDALAAGGPSQVLNLGTGTGASVREVVTAVRDVTGRDVPVVAGARRAGDPAEVWADPRKAAAVLGWRASRSLTTIISSAWRWHTRVARDASSASAEPVHRTQAERPGVRADPRQ